MTLENDKRFKEFEKRMMENVASLMFRPEQFFRPQEQVFMPQHPLYRGETSDPLYRAATSSCGEPGCSSRLHGTLIKISYSWRLNIHMSGLAGRMSILIEF
ncbi:hypothetical protein MKX03_021205 [Papaver bracteatum]|nr:hypothetical protein MKX03_021205 [Papaver bracteatum]